MIGYLSGILKFKYQETIILDVKSVGYLIFAPLYVIAESKIKEKKEFYIYTHVRENEISLFGFLSLEDRQIFENLISVSGIGPKTALNILSFSNGAKNIIKAVQGADVDFFKGIKGIAKKSAQRIIVDLKPKIGGLKEIEFETELDRDLIAALKGLGFNDQEIKKAIKGIKKDLPLEEKIKLALKNKE